MKTPRRKFLKTAAFAGAAATAVPGLLTSCVSTGGGEAGSGTTPSAQRPPRGTFLFDNKWKFHLGDVAGAHEAAFDDNDWRTLNLPHDFSIEQPFSQDKASCAGYLPGGIGWYRSTYPIASASPLLLRRVALLFEGVYNHSEVWVNGHSLGKHPYGYTSFHYDITDFLRGGDMNTIAVRVDHSEDADTRWYNGSGIYRPAWLIATHDVRVPVWGTFVTTPEVSRDSATVSIATRVRNDSKQAVEANLVSIILDGGGKQVGSVETPQSIAANKEHRFEQSVKVANPMLWSPDTPRLYTVRHEVRVDGKVVDQYETPFGIRWFEFDANKGFSLNGEHMLIKGVCVHHEAGCLGAAFWVDAWKRRLQTLKELGCNAIRMSHNPPAPELLDLCDTMGFLVMDEAFDEWALPKKKWITGRNNGQPGSQGYAKDFAEWSTRDIQSMVERDRNHPSIILWSIGNEIDYPRDPYYDPSMNDNSPDRPQATDLPAIAAKLVKAIKELDTTRPVTAALANISASNKTGYPETLDVVGYNYTETAYRGDHEKFPARKIIGSENSQNFQAWQPVIDLPYATGQFLWTGIDYIGEAGLWPSRGSSAGLLDECGFKKPLAYFRQSLWSDKPMVYLATRQGGAGRGGGRGGGGGNIAPTWNLQLSEGAVANVVCYTNCEKVELFLNGKSLGEKAQSEGQNRTLTWQVPYSAGTLKAVGKNGGATACAFELKTAGAPRNLQLSADLMSIPADGRSLSHVVVNVTDEAGVPIYAAQDQVNFELTGPGRIIGVDSGDMRSHESFQAPTRKLFQGKCLVIIQSTQKAGTIKLTATATGLTPATATVTARSAI
jgi:hypothetical protein